MIRRTLTLLAATLVVPGMALAQPAPATAPAAAPATAPAAPADPNAPADQGAVTEGGSPLEVGSDVAESEAEKDPFNLLVISLNVNPAGATPGSQAETDLLKAAQEDKLPEAYYNLGVLYLRAGMLDRAWGFFDKTLELSPTFSEAVALQGYIHGMRGQNAECLALIEKAVGMNKYCAPARNFYARKALADGNYDEAIRHCRIALLGDPANTNIYLNLALAYFRKGNMELADFIVKEGLAAQSSKAPLLNLRGIIALKRNDVRGAFRSFEEAHAQDPTYTDALKNLAAMELNYKAFDAALERIDEVLAKEPENLQYQISRAVALRGLGRLPEAKTLLESLERANPANFEIAYNDCILHMEYIKERESAVVKCDRALGLIQKGHPKFVELGKRVKRIKEEIELLKNTPPDEPPPPQTPAPTPESPDKAPKPEGSAAPVEGGAPSAEPPKEAPAEAPKEAPKETPAPPEGEGQK